MVYVASLECSSNNQEGDVHPFYRAQIAALLANEALTLISTEYSDFVDIFSLELASKLLEHTKINDHIIKLVDDWQSSYGPIYSFKPIKLEILKTYIKTNLVNNFIRPSKSLVRALIFFDKKPDRSRQIYVDY